jgi:hypothetical protein
VAGRIANLVNRRLDQSMCISLEAYARDDCVLPDSSSRPALLWPHGCQVYVTVAAPESSKVEQVVLSPSLVVRPSSSPGFPMVFLTVPLEQRTVDGRVDLSSFFCAGANTVSLHQQCQLTDVVFAFRAHRPTEGQLAPIKASLELQKQLEAVFNAPRTLPRHPMVDELRAAFPRFTSDSSSVNA